MARYKQRERCVWMTTNLVEWASGYRQITKNRPSDANRGKTFQRRCNLGMFRAGLKIIWKGRMNKLQEFEEFFASQAGHISVFSLALNMVLTAIACAVLGWVYIRFGTSLSNRHSLAKIFVLVGVTTTLVITIVKASLALSLGLVGALSIVRFRAAIKEPEELAFLFLTIGLGLGFGAEQTGTTILAFALIIACYLTYRRFFLVKHSQENFVLTVTGGGALGDDLAGIVELLEKTCVHAELKRYEKREQDVEAVFLVEIQDFASFERLNRDLTTIPGIPSFSLVEDIRLV